VGVGGGGFNGRLPVRHRRRARVVAGARWPPLLGLHVGDREVTRLEPERWPRQAPEKRPPPMFFRS
jgi:hypothetical protein